MAALSPVLTQATNIIASHGEGVYLFDEGGRRYLDFTSGIGVTSTGHAHPRVVAAATQQAAKIIHAQFTTVLHRPLLDLVAAMGEVLPETTDALFFANSGSEAVEAALRLARQATGRPNVVVFHGSFHGRSVAAASMTTSSTKYRSGFSPMMAGVVVSAFPEPLHYGLSPAQATQFALKQLDYTLQTISNPNDTAAFFIEPVLGEGGYIPVTQEFMAGLRERANRYGILLVADEVQSGYGRTGTFWAHQQLGTTPDILITAKGIASGFPLSAIAAPEALMRKVWPGTQGGTYGANAVACAAAVATLQVIRAENLVDNAAKRGAQLRSLLETTASACPVIADVRGLGLMQGVEFRDADGNPDGKAASEVVKACLAEGLMLLTCGAWGHVVRFIPALVVDQSQIATAAAIFGRAVAGLSEA